MELVAGGDINARATPTYFRGYNEALQQLTIELNPIRTAA